MKKLFLLSVFVTSVVAAQVYPYFPVPNISYTESTALMGVDTPSNVSGTPAYRGAKFNLCGNDVDVAGTGNCILQLGPDPVAGTGTFNDLAIVLSAPGGTINAPEIAFINATNSAANPPLFVNAPGIPGIVDVGGGLQFESQSTGADMLFWIQNANGNYNEFQLSANNDTRFVVNAGTGVASDGSFGILNKSVDAHATTNIPILTSNGANIFDLACTSTAGTLAANGSGPGGSAPISGAPTRPGCAIIGGGRDLIFVGHVYDGGIDNNDNWQIGAALSGKIVNISTDTAADSQSNGVPIVTQTLSAPTISSGFGSGASVPHNAGPKSFSVNVGTGGSASSGVIGLPTASNAWSCSSSDTGTTPTGRTEPTAGSVNSITLTNYSRTTGSPVAWTASEIIQVSCWAN